MFKIWLKFPLQSQRHGMLVLTPDLCFLFCILVFSTPDLLLVASINCWLHFGLLRFHVLYIFFFGRSLQPRGLAETLCGSPLYMAPEIMQLQKYDAKVGYLMCFCLSLFVVGTHNRLIYCFSTVLGYEYAGRSLECRCNFISACNWKNPFHWKQSNTGFFFFFFGLLYSCFFLFGNYEVVYNVLMGSICMFTYFNICHIEYLVQFHPRMLCSCSRTLWNQLDWTSLQIAVIFWVLSAKICAKNCCVVIQVCCTM